MALPGMALPGMDRASRLRLQTAPTDYASLGRLSRIDPSRWSVDRESILHKRHRCIPLTIAPAFKFHGPAIAPRRR
jgi:hypothetical protein